MKRKEKIFWRCFWPCGLLIVCTWLNFMEERTLASGVVWFLSLLSAVVPVAAANLTSKH